MEETQEKIIPPKETPKPFDPDKKPTPKKSVSIEKVVMGVLILTVVIAVIIAVKLQLGSNDEAARVNGEAITFAELETRYAKIPETYKVFLTKRSFLNQLVEEKLLMQEALKAGITLTPKDIDEAYTKTLVDLGLTNEEFMQQLTSFNVTEMDVKESLKVQLLLNKLIERNLANELKVTDADAQLYYTENLDQFVIPDQVRASHILIGTGDKNESVAKAVAQALLRGPELKNNFSAAAGEYSEDTGSAVQGGDLGFFSKGQMVKEFEEAAFSLKVGEMSGLIKTQFGYHIILVTNSTKGRTQLFDEVKTPLFEYLTSQKKQAAVQTYVANLKSVATITMFMPDDVVKNDTEVIQVGN